MMLGAVIVMGAVMWYRGVFAGVGGVSRIKWEGS